MTKMFHDMIPTPAGELAVSPKLLAGFISGGGRRKNKEERGKKGEVRYRPTGRKRRNRKERGGVGAT